MWRRTTALGGCPRRGYANGRLLGSNSQKWIEVEAKFRIDASALLSPSGGGIASLIAHSRMLSRTVFTDTYYDLTDPPDHCPHYPHHYPLTTNDIWLRRRNRGLECKVPIIDTSESNETKKNDPNQHTLPRVDRYEELSRVSDIVARLSRVLGNNGGDAQLAYANADDDDENQLWMRWPTLRPFCRIESTRTKYDYKGGTATIDIDETDFGYHIGEIEVMVEGSDVPGEMQRRLRDAESCIQRICAEHALDSGASIRGKVLEYVARNNRPLYALWQQSGLLKSKGIAS
eukprot:TRINITY_DN3145_c0_g1_i1.p1 TRINITY_DN3145_c0_g1~~TRINITY_DN3145_c0_g1_i1.p1  ORF type:complete len:288 (+),score=37.62 TRINITY_DN3145_c0_g1_i1:116-979(+)